MSKSFCKKYSLIGMKVTVRGAASTTESLQLSWQRTGGCQLQELAAWSVQSIKAAWNDTLKITTRQTIRITPVKKRIFSNFILSFL